MSLETQGQLVGARESQRQGKVVKSASDQWSLSSFLVFEVTGSTSTPPLDGMLVHCRVTLIAFKFAVTHLEALRKLLVPCPKTRHNDPGQGSNTDCLIQKIVCFHVSPSGAYHQNFKVLPSQKTFLLETLLVGLVLLLVGIN